MKGSIRKFLLINLLLAMVLTTILTSIGNYYLDTKDIRTHLDFLLGQASYNIEALLGNTTDAKHLKMLQNELNNIPLRVHKDSTPYFSSLVKSHENYQIQVWDKNGNLLLSSFNAPKEPLSNGTEGYHTKSIHGIEWRTFTKHNLKTGVYVVVAEKDGMQSLLAHSLAIDNIYIMLIIYPLAAFLIWIIVGKGLASIRKVADEVSHRVPNYLEPVNADSVPKELRSLVVELNKLFLRLHQALEREKRFAGDAAHELRTPLAALRTQTQVTLKTKDPVERKKMLSNIVVAVDRCTHIVQQLLTLSRLVPESNTLSDTSAVDLAKLAAEIVAQIAPLAIEKNIDIELLSDEKHPCIISGNITALSILIRNLVDNAIRYTPDAGKITVSVKTTETDLDKISLKVIDNGPGIPAELRARVFERFFRVLGNKSPGSGLGLAIVQQIASLHEAQVKLGTPATGKGLEVEILFNTLKAL